MSDDRPHFMDETELAAHREALDRLSKACNCPGDYARYPSDDPHNAWCPQSRNPIVSRIRGEKA